jgi:hypothetical protein
MTTTSKLLAPIVLSVSCTIAACGSSGGGPGDAGQDSGIDAGASADTAMARTVRQQCERVAAATNALRAGCFVATGESKYTELTTPREVNNFVEACTLEASAPGYGLGNLDTCAAELEKVTLCRVELADIRSCKTPRGTAALGTICNYNSQCASGYCPHVTAGGGVPPLCGTCAPETSPQPATPLPAGAACTASGECHSGADCRGQKCIARASLGQPCGGGDPDTPVLCAIGNCVANVCRPAGALGEDCAQVGCRSSLYCDANKRCVATTLAAPGAACGADQSTPTTCPTGYVCAASNAGQASSCVELAAVESNWGEPCGPIAGGGKRQCGKPLRCVDNKCQIDYPVLCK